jgi:hypothetical protein
MFDLSTQEIVIAAAIAGLILVLSLVLWIVGRDR